MRPAALASAAVLFAGAMAGPAGAAAEGPAFFPAAQCAAFWSAYADFQRRYAIAEPPDGSSDAAAAAFGKAAIRLNRGDAAEIDSYIKEQKPLMMLLHKSFMIDGDPDSRDMFTRLSRTCEDFAATQPETRATQ